MSLYMSTYPVLNIYLQVISFLSIFHVLVESAQYSFFLLFLGEFKFYWASNTSDSLARMGEWYNQLAIHTEM